MTNDKYSEKAGGSLWRGINPQCLPLDPNYLKYEPGKQPYSLMYGAKYQLTNGMVPNSYETDIPCAVCYVPTRTKLYMMPTKYTCSSNWTLSLMDIITKWNHSAHYRSQFTCVEKLLKPIMMNLWPVLH